MPDANLARLGEEYLSLQHATVPSHETLLGVSGFDALVPDVSREGSAAAAARFAELEGRIAALDLAAMDQADAVPAPVLAHLTHSARSDHEHALWEAGASAAGYVNPQALLFQAVPRASLPDAAAVAGYLTRLQALPGQVHEIGLQYVRDLESEWADLGLRVLGTADVPDVLQRLRDDPALRFSRAEQIVSVVQAALHREEAARDDWFPPYGLADCVIEEIDPLEAGNAALAHYRPPAGDGSRPGAHCVLTAAPEQRFAYESEALVFHESVPGHHLQIASAQGLPGLPTYRWFLAVWSAARSRDGRRPASGSPTRWAHTPGRRPARDAVVRGAARVPARRRHRHALARLVPCAGCRVHVVQHRHDPGPMSRTRSTATSAGPARPWPT